MTHSEGIPASECSVRWTTRNDTAPRLRPPDPSHASCPCYGGNLSRATTFEGAQFSGTTRLGDARFSDEAWFDRAEFSGSARFSRVEFSGTTRFDDARFSDEAWFDGAQFNGDTSFHETHFHQEPELALAKASHPNSSHVWPLPWRAVPTAPDADTAQLVRQE
ncbi:pentapeptide repeat-containing protein [Spirillospora sp. NPDC049024]